ncbi:YheT family hydrolase [Yunchengibacter salinarum]|uniref:YheT family hydrolase n=1 Tax=Yunchengibacter salinarum TaxID=3133399 RepID=UPI0035B609D5
MRILGRLRDEIGADGTGMLPPFQPRFPWLSGDLQTVRNTLVREAAGAAADRRLSLPITGQRGARLSIAVTDPAAPAPDHELDPHADEVPRPNGRAVLLLHGIAGNEGSVYMTATARRFSARGWRVYRMNYRGAGPSRATSRAPYHAGLTDDVRDVIAALPREEFPEGLSLMGFSLGGQLTLRLLGEDGAAGRDPAVRSAVTVSAPLNLSHCQKALERTRNRLYMRYLVRDMKRELGNLWPRAITRPGDSIDTVRQLDNHVICPVFGFRDAEDYYARASAIYHLADIRRPFLAIHGDDDPWIPSGDYEAAPWPDVPGTGAALLSGGGHVGFHDRAFRDPWFVAAALAYFDKY